MDESIEDTTSFEQPFDYKPLEKGKFQKLEESVYSLLSRKKQPVIKQEPIMVGKVGPITPAEAHKLQASSVALDVEEWHNTQISPTHEVQNGLVFQKKTFAEKARDQLKFPQISKVPAVINGAALLVFAVGAYILYSELPTRPELVVGIILVSVAGNVIVSQR
jgi:hypothetical protein